MVAALRAYFARQRGSPAVFLYEVHRNVASTSTRALAIGVVGDFDGAIAAIVPEPYGTLPVDITFIGGTQRSAKRLEALGSP